MANDFQRADVVVAAMYEAISRLPGVTDDILEQAWAKLEAEAAAFNA